MQEEIRKALGKIRRIEWSFGDGVTEKIFQDDGGQNYLSYVRRSDVIEIIGSIAGIRVDYKKIGERERLAVSGDPDITDFLFDQIQIFQALAIPA